LDVHTPSGQTLSVDDPALLAMLAEECSPSGLSLLRSHRAMADCRPVSLVSLQTVEQLDREVNAPLDRRRFRANLSAQLGTAKGFGVCRSPAAHWFAGRHRRAGARYTVQDDHD
jgi:hypothetical protein